MIAYLSGEVIQNSISSLIVLTGGVGYRVFVTPDFADTKVGSQVSMYVHHKVAEDGQSLYGVPTFEALKMFEMLITVSGVGPKVALAVLSQLPVATVQQAISNQDASTFTRISGIGGKTAERIILDLKGKVLSVPGTPGGKVTGEVFDALLALGYSQTEVRAVLPKLPPSGSVGEQIKLALQHFSKK